MDQKKPLSVEHWHEQGQNDINKAQYNHLKDIANALRCAIEENIK